MRRFVLPNRLSLLLASEWRRRLDDWLLGEERKKMREVRSSDEVMASVAMPEPEGVLRVTVFEAEDLKATDLSFRHYCTKEGRRNLNPLRPAEFSLAELLPKRSSADTYVVASVGKERYSSDVARGQLSPTWDFSCEFVAEFYNRALIRLEVLARDVAGQDEPLGTVSERICRVRRKGAVEGWYNCQTDKGRIRLRLEWVPLVLAAAAASASTPPSSPLPGVICLFLGRLTCRDKLRPTVHLNLVRRLDEENSLLTTKSLEALSYATSLSFDEGKVLRVPDLLDPELLLVVGIHGENVIGKRRFKVASLVTKRLEGPYWFGPEQSVSLILRSKVLCDSVKEEEGKDGN